MEFCEACEKRAKQCPSGAIPYGLRDWGSVCDANNPGAFRWYCDEEACLRYWNEVGSGCSVCLRVCNFTKDEGVIHDVVKWFIKNVPQQDRFWVWVDELICYRKMSDPRKYWDSV